LRNSTKAAAIILIIVAIAGSIILLPYIEKFNVPSQDVLAVSSINLQQNGVHGSDGAVKGGDWRILATTGSADIYFLQLNQSTLNSYGAKAQYPDDIQITGSVTFGAFQTYYPFWYVQVHKIQDVTVYPKITGSYKTGQDTAHTIDPMVVSIWETDPSTMQLMIPFSIGILKTYGSNLGSFTTNYPGARIQTSEDGNYYQFSISAEDIASGNMTNMIVFTNPSDPSETVKITLQFTVGSSFQLPTEPWVIITEQGGGEVNNNVFHYSDLQTILSVLDYTRGNDWSYYHYWFGGGNVFQANGHTSFGGSSVASNHAYPLSSWSDGSVAPIFGPIATPPYGSFTYVLDEGYSYPTYNTNDNRQLPGWYTPAPGNNEGITLSDYWNYRLPLAGALHNDLSNTIPQGLSIVDYLTQSFSYQGKVKPFNLERINVNYWGKGGQGSCPAGIGVAIPKEARQWVFTIDVSTETVDTIVVDENHIDVRISNFHLDMDTIGKDQTATVTCTLTNESPFRGKVSVGVNLPASLSYSVKTAGNLGIVTFEAGESKPFTFSLTNTGNFVEDTGKTKLTLTVTNTEPYVTDHKDFEINFLQGLGVPYTTIKVTTQDADSNKPISGLTVQVYYGQTMTDTLSPLTTQDGSATFDLGVYTGYAKVVVTDNAGRYASQDKTIGPLNHGTNEVTFKMILKGSDTGQSDNSLMYIILAVAVIIIILVVAVIAYAVKKKR
jgi:hypothetical protein